MLNPRLLLIIFHLVSLGFRQEQSQQIHRVSMVCNGTILATVDIDPSSQTDLV